MSLKKFAKYKNFSLKTQSIQLRESCLFVSFVEMRQSKLKKTYLFEKIFGSLYITFIWVCLTVPCWGQILNDTTENIYGFSTTLWIREYEIFRRRDTVFQKIDTTLTNFHRFGVVRKSHFLYQDLGHNLGTPVKLIFYELPSQVGVQWGIKSYEAYKVHPDSVYYYDTKSPYSDFYFIQGGRGQQIAGVEFTRNVTARANFGFIFQRTNTFRQYAFSPNRTENAILEQYWALAWLRVFSKNRRYQLLAHYHHFNSPLKELGGVKNGDKPEVLYNYQQTEAQLIGEPRSWQIYDRVRFYQEYSLDSGRRRVSLFHTIQFEKQRDSYFDGNFEANQAFYLQGAMPTMPIIDGFSLNLKEVNDDYRFRLLTNQAGMRMSFTKINLWAYLKRRDIGLKSNWQYWYRIANLAENYVGVMLEGDLEKRVQWGVRTEYLLGKSDYLFEGKASQSFWSVNLKSISFAPALVENRYFSRIRAWDYQDKLRNTSAQEILGELVWSFNSLQLKPLLRYQLVSNYIFFNRDTTGFIFPDQTQGMLAIGQLGLYAKWHMGYFSFENQLFYTKEFSQLGVIRFPRWYLWGSWYYERGFFREALLLRVGVDWRWQSAYFADAYMPALKQFYLQNSFLVRAYPVSDLFISFKIRKVRAFLKLTHWNEGLLPFPDNGYVVTPFYAGFRRTFGLGISWRLFD